MSYNFQQIQKYLRMKRNVLLSSINDSIGVVIADEDMAEKDVSISHSKFSYDGYDYYWHHDYHSRVVQYYKCKHSSSA